MVISLKHAFQSPVADDGDPNTVGSNEWNAEHALTMATARLLGRQSAGAGAAEELSLSQVLDLVGSAAQGDLLYRGLSAWARLPAGAADQRLLSAVPTADPSWGGGLRNVASGAVPAATTFDIINIPQHYSFLLLTLSGISSTVASRAARLFSSSDNGASFNTADYNGLVLVGGVSPAAFSSGFIDPGVLTSAADTITAGILLLGYQVNNRQLAIGFTSASGGGNRVSLTRCTGTGAINALRLAWDASGNFDAGTYNLFGAA